VAFSARFGYPGRDTDVRRISDRAAAAAAIAGRRNIILRVHPMIRFRRAVLFFAAFQFIAYGFVAAQEGRSGGRAASGGTLHPNDEVAAIRAASQDFIAAFERGDAKATAALWTEDGELVDGSGRVFTGRPAIEEEYARFYAANPGVKLRITVDAVRLLGNDAAIEDGRAVLEPAPAGVPTTGKYTAVHVKRDGKWLMTTVRESHEEVPSTYRNLQDFEWLVGEWAGEEHGATTKSVCRWLPGKSFLERRYSVADVGGRQSSGLQLIGWDSQKGRVVSWNFTSDGGHAVGVWAPRPNGWAIETVGYHLDGTETRAVNLLTRLDNNAYAWQSIHRSVNGASRPDTDEIVIKRDTRSQ
jgi:uncharacterized protein (TIGR02246 family)